MQIYIKVIYTHTHIVFEEIIAEKPYKPDESYKSRDPISSTNPKLNKLDIIIKHIIIKLIQTSDKEKKS